MALFNIRWPGKKDDGEQAVPGAKRPSRLAQGESVEAMRRRARHRLIGAAVLVLAGVIGFPLLFDTQPRPVPVDIPIEIPDRGNAAPVVVPGANAVSGEAASNGQVTARASLGDGEEEIPSRGAAPVPKPAPAPMVAPVVASAPVPAVVPVVPPAPKPEAKPEVKPERKPEPKPESKPEPKHKPEAKPEAKSEPKPEPRRKPEPSKSDDAARARALLEGRSVPVAAAEPASSGSERFIVQIGAFAETSKAGEIKSRLGGAGLHAFTQTVDTKDGKRTRVRVGPFSSRADADKAAARVKGLGLPASVFKG
ncbi:hypothetical protein GCM10010975_13490 [Comamonas phosphati]|nr:hypothetical protein GCM10010975_13490 [Comamonas phosphati]